MGAFAVSEFEDVEKGDADFDVLLIVFAALIVVVVSEGMANGRSMPRERCSNSFFMFVQNVSATSLIEGAAFL